MNERVKELDGLRGVAIILVIALHTFRRASNFTQHPVLLFITDLTGVGWVGVDIFFALSGFLITSILLRTREAENYFKNFYIRRALRIFPLYFVGIAVILSLVPILDPDFTSRIPRALPFLLLYQQNWLEIFGDTRLTQYLTVTWSLAIEEQFYLIWPAIVYFSRKETLIKIGLCVIVYSILARLLGVLLWNDLSQVTNFFFYNTFTRFEELTFGSLLALAFTLPDWKERIGRIAMPVFQASLLVFLLLCLITFKNSPHPVNSNIPLTIGGYTSAALFSTALIALFATRPEKSILRRVFQNRILVFFGKYSYSMYLLHLPIALILLESLWHTGLRGWKMYVAYILLTYGVTVLVSLLTWHVLEKHMLNLKKYFEYSGSAGKKAAKTRTADI